MKYCSLKEGCHDFFLLLDNVLTVLDRVMVKLWVVVDPLKCTEWRQEFAVVEASGCTNWIVSWGAHHWWLDHGLSFLVIVVILKIFPDPERASIEWSKIVTDHKLLTKLIVSSNSLLIGLWKGPLEWLLIDVSASVTNLIELVEISVFFTPLYMDWLSWHHLSLHFDSTNLKLASIKLVKSIVIVFGNSDAL